LPAPRIRIFRNANELRKELTPAEEILWNYLRCRRLNNLKFRKQHPVLRFIADFYCHEVKLIIEVDGQIHDLTSNKEHDEGRTYELSEYGITVLRFTNDDILNDLNSVLNKINFEAQRIIKANLFIKK